MSELCKMFRHLMLEESRLSRLEFSDKDIDAKAVYAEQLMNHQRLFEAFCKSLEEDKTNAGRYRYLMDHLIRHEVQSDGPILFATFKIVRFDQAHKNKDMQKLATECIDYMMTLPNDVTKDPKVPE